MAIIKKEMPKDEELDEQRPDDEIPEGEEDVTGDPQPEEEITGEPEDDSAEADEEPAEGELTPASVRENLQLPDNLKDAYDRVVLAGMKVMFDPQTHEMAMKLMQGDGPVDERLGKAIAALMGTLIKESNNTMPPQIIIPAGIELTVAAGDYLKQSEQGVTDDDIAGAMAEFVQIVLEQIGAGSPEQMQQMLQQAQQQGGAAAAGGQSALEGAQTPASGPQGLVGQEMGA